MFEFESINCLSTPESFHSLLKNGFINFLKSMNFLKVTDLFEGVILSSFGPRSPFLLAVSL